MFVRSGVEEFHDCDSFKLTLLVFLLSVRAGSVVFIDIPLPLRLHAVNDEDELKIIVFELLNFFPEVLDVFLVKFEVIFRSIGAQQVDDWPTSVKTKMRIFMVVNWLNPPLALSGNVRSVATSTFGSSTTLRSRGR